MRRALPLSSISALALLAVGRGRSGCGSTAAVAPDGGGRAARRRRRRRHGGGGAAVPDGPRADQLRRSLGPIDPTALIDDMEAPDS